MKTKIFSLILSAAALTGLSACDSWEPEGKVDGKGQLNTATIGVEVDGAEALVADNSGAKNLPAKAKGSRANATVDLTNFIVTVEDKNGQEVNRWTYTTMPELPVFPVGDYTVKVRSHEVEPAAWNAPYYEGTQDFTIETDKITEVPTIVCTLSNIRVSVTFTDDLKNAFDNPSDVTVKVTSEGNNSLVFTPSETRSGYFAALQNLETLRVDFSASIMGQVETFTKTIDNVAKGQHRKITFGLTGNPNLPPEEIGTITNDGQGITVDSDVIEDAPIESDYPWFEDNIDDSGRPGNEDFDDNQGGGGEDPDDPNPPTPPTPPADVISFESTSLNLNGMNYAADFPSDGSKPAAVNITSENGIANLLVEIISESLSDEMLQGVGLTATFDLAYPGSLNDVLSNPEGFNFPTKEKVIGQKAVTFNIAPFVPLLNIYPGELHQFKITVTDIEGNTAVQVLKFQS